MQGYVTYLWKKAALSINLTFCKCGNKIIQNDKVFKIMFLPLKNLSLIDALCFQKLSFLLYVYAFFKQ